MKVTVALTFDSPSNQQALALNDLHPTARRCQAPSLPADVGAQIGEYHH